MIVPMKWAERAACAGTDTEAFFPEKGGRGDKLVQRICASCPVRAECLAHALEHEGFGVWGGTSQNQRNYINGRRKPRERVQRRPA